MSDLNTTSSHSNLIAAGFVGKVATSDVKRAGLLADLYAAQDAGLARFHSAVTIGSTGVKTFFYIYG